MKNLLIYFLIFIPGVAIAVTNLISQTQPGLKSVINLRETAVPDELQHLTNFSTQGKIVFYSNRSGNPDIYIMNEDGSGQIQLTTETASDLVPDFSPDGSRILFCSDRDGNYEIYVMNNDGSNAHRLTSSSENEDHPCWSPDGLKVLFIKDYSTKTEIWMMDSDGNNQKKLTSNNARDERPFLSPDGSTILFMSNRDGNYEIYLMDIDGSNQRRITNTIRHEIFPTWSPDGSKIAYSQNYLSGGVPQAEVHLINPDGSEDIVLTSSAGRDENPRWSPDGNYLVFQSERDGNFEIYKMSKDGSDQQRLTNIAGWDGWASWNQTQVSSTGQLNEQLEQFDLNQNFPNPFNNQTNFNFSLREQASVSLRIYNVIGKLVASPLVNKVYSIGSHSFQFDSEGLSSGIYYYLLELNNMRVSMKKMCLLK